MTTVTAERRPLFQNLFSARAVIRVMRQLQAEGLAETLAFVVMPDHVHWLMVLGPSSMGMVMQRFKGRSSRSLNALTGGRQRVWQRGYYDHAVRLEEKLVVLARYIVANPIRAGLVESVGDFPHWDCVWL